jgi:hypothetical protein
MEYFNEAVQAISTVGFPIVACYALFKQSQSQSEALNSMAISIQKLTDKIDVLITKESKNED